MFKSRTHAKWILAGEHSVLRGGKALVFPLSGRFLDFEFEPGEELTLEVVRGSLESTSSGKLGEGVSQSPEMASYTCLEMAFWGVFEKALQTLKMSRKDVTGKIRLSSNIPVGAGMGASATLCVSLAKWFTELSFLAPGDQYEFAKGLENLFHGESSGVDVAVALNNKALVFKKPSEIEFFEPKWEPHFYLSYSGKRGVTADCIRQVQALMSSDPQRGADIDQTMFEAVDKAIESLTTIDDNAGMKKAIEQANSCFESWGLLSAQICEHQSRIMSSGALATKPTGSGDGGYVLSFWQKEPSPEIVRTLGLIKA